MNEKAIWRLVVENKPQGIPVVNLNLSLFCQEEYGFIAVCTLASANKIF